MSVTSVLTSSFFDMVGPAFTTSGRHLRQILDVLLDGHGIMTQGLYLGVFAFVFGLIAFGTFLKLTGFRFKLSSIFLGVECGPTQAIKKIKNYFIYFTKANNQRANGVTDCTGHCRENGLESTAN